MSDSNRQSGQFWKEVVVPAVRGLERFFWNLAWFLVLVCVLTSFNPFRYLQGGGPDEDRPAPAVRHQALSQQPTAQR